MCRAVVMVLALAFAAAAANADFLISERTYRSLSEAEEQMQAEDYAGALASIDRALKSGRGMNGYERALFERLAGAVHISTGDYTAAAARFAAALSGEHLPAAIMEQLRYKLAQLYLHEERYDDALAQLKPWMDQAAQPSADVCFLIAATHAALESFADALAWGERGLAQAETPAERQYAFVSGLNLTLERYPRAAELLEQMIVRYPKNAQYWRQLAGVYGALEREERALAITELGHLQGVLRSERDLDRLAKLYLHHEVPHKAALLLDNALQADHAFDAARYRLLANAWVAAREYARALTPLETTASLLHAGGDLDEEADVRLLKGIAHANLEQHAKAAREFEHCLKFEKTRTTAEQWLRYVGEGA